MKRHLKLQGYEYLYLTSKDVSAKKICLLPVGSIESHGKGLPLGTDSLIAQAFAHAFACKVNGLALPVLPYGFCPNTARFKGTITPGAEALYDYLKDICLSLLENKFRRIIILNIHKGNDALIKMMVDDVFQSYGLSIYYVNPYTFLGEKVNHSIFDGKDNSYKEACLLLASLKILNDKINPTYISNRDESIPRHSELESLRYHGTLGFTYPDEKYHIATRKDVDINKGIVYFKMAEEKIKELVRTWRNLSKR